VKDFLSILRRCMNPKIKVSGETRIPPGCDCISSDQKILNLVSIQQIQELFEVVGQFDHRGRFASSIVPESATAVPLSWTSIPVVWRRQQRQKN
jgi:hypothetical protein